MNTSQASTPGVLKNVRFRILIGRRLGKLSWYVSKERNMLRTLFLEILQNLIRNASVIGWIVLGSSGLKYRDLTALLFSSTVANGFPLYISFPLSTVRFFMYLHHAGFSLPLTIAMTASWIRFVPTFINNMLRCSFVIGTSDTVVFRIHGARDIASTRAFAVSSAVLHSGVSLFSHTASASASSCKYLRGFFACRDDRRAMILY